MDAIAFGHLAFHAYPSLNESRLFSILTFEAPNLIAFVSRIKDYYLKDPIQRKELDRPVSNFISARFPQWVAYYLVSPHPNDPLPTTKDEKMNRFYRGLTLFTCLAVGGLVLSRVKAAPRCS
jgi:metaxin